MTYLVVYYSTLFTKSGTTSLANNIINSLIML